MYKTDDMVMYGKNGVCRVIGVVRMSGARFEPERDFYALAPLHDKNSTYYVPVDSPLVNTKLRSVMSKSEIDKTLARAKKATMEWIDDRALRSIRFKEILVAGDRGEMLTLANCIYRRKVEAEKEGKRLWSIDEQVLESVERLISEEFACALGISQNKVGAYIRKKLGVE